MEVTTEDNKELIVLTKSEYEQLLKDSEILNHLYELGVDNWEGYSLP